MSFEQVSKEHYIEGLTRLSANVGQIDHRKTTWQYADHVCSQSHGIEARLSLPELADWREFCADMAAELKAASEIGRQVFQIELLSCRKLAIVLEIGCYREHPQLPLDAIIELDTAAARLSATETPIDYVTLQQCAGIVNRSKRQLERWKTNDTAFPTPEIIGDNGEADEWSWATIRPYLETKAKRKLPAIFPAHIAR